jgi:predicted Fe-Mo cluster-binding NifX family protein
MKLAVTARGDNLDADVDPRFGRCRYFVVIDPETMEFDSFENKSAMAMGGAGPQATQEISGRGVDVVITGNVGPNAFQALKAAGIKVITGASGTVKDMIDRYVGGELEETEGASVGSHSGIGRK